MKGKLTLTVDKDVIEKAKQIARCKGVKISGMVEKYLMFLSDPWVYCFQCGEKFTSKKAKICPKCGWMTCLWCGACGCGLSEDAAAAVFQMRKV